MTLTDLANSSLRLLGAMPSGASLGAGSVQLTDALSAANDLLDNWSSDRLMAVSALVTQQALSAGTGSYTIGSGATINITRPNQVEAASCIISGLHMPVKVLDAAAWNALEDRDATAPMVEYLFYDRGWTTSSAQGKIYVSPKPTGTPTLEIVTWSALAPFADTTTSLNIPPGYARLLRLALAIELAPQYRMQVPDTVMRDYADALAAVRALNASILGGEVPQPAVK